MIGLKERKRKRGRDQLASFSLALEEKAERKKRKKRTDLVGVKSIVKPLKLSSQSFERAPQLSTIRFEVRETRLKVVQSSTVSYQRKVSFCCLSTNQRKVYFARR